MSQVFNDETHLIYWSDFHVSGPPGHLIGRGVRKL
jgi:hypothetical protein